MTIEAKRRKVSEYCNSVGCARCVLKLEVGAWSKPINPHTTSCLYIAHSPDKDIERAYSMIREHLKSEDSTDEKDIVNCPAHYTDGKIEVIEYIEDKKLGFCLGNAIKYISRAGKKDKSKEIEDLKKAIWYINRRIKEIEEASKID